MSNQNLPPIGTFQLYGAGGAGTNIIGSWNDLHGKSEMGTAKHSVAYIDTSISNLPENVDMNNVFVLEDTDGSGRVRKSNHLEISRNVAKILQKFPPKDFNVVAFSASGGSGSVIGPLICAELMERGVSFVAVVIGSEESAITCDNSLKTLKTLDNLARTKGRPLVMFYQHNSQTTKRSAVDIECRYVLAGLSMLASRRNRELDTADIANWLNYPNVPNCTVDAQLSLLNVYDDFNKVDEGALPVSVASLKSDPDQPTFAAVPDYTCVGFPREAIEKFNELHFVVTIEGVPKINKMFLDRLAQLDGQKGARVKQDSIVGKNDVASEDGMIF